MTESRADEFRKYSRGLFDDMMCAEGEVILDRGCQYIKELEQALATERAARTRAKGRYYAIDTVRGRLQIELDAERAVRGMEENRLHEVQKGLLNQIEIEKAARELAEAKLDKLAINFGDDYKL